MEEYGAGLYIFGCLPKQPIFAVNYEELNNKNLINLPVTFNMNKQMIYIINRRQAVVVLKMLIKLKAWKPSLV